MKVTIAHKKHSAGILYIVLAIIGIVAIVFGFVRDETPIAIFGAVLTLSAGILSVQYLSMPSNIIVLTEDNTLMLPRGVKITTASITDVSYRRASAKSIQYRWGSVTLSTSCGKYKLRFVADCEEVSKQITKLMYTYNN